MMCESRHRDLRVCYRAVFVVLYCTVFECLLSSDVDMVNVSVSGQILVSQRPEALLEGVSG